MDLRFGEYLETYQIFNHPHPANTLSFFTFFARLPRIRSTVASEGVKDAAYDLGPERDSTAAGVVKIAQSPLITFSFWEALSSIPSKCF